MKIARRVLMVCSALLVAFLLIAPQLIGIVFGMTSPDTLALLKPALRLFALYIPFSGAILLLQNFYNTTERRSLATSLVVMDGFLFVVPFAVLLSSIQSNLLWLCYAASGACTLLTLLLLARRIRKKENVQGLLMIRERNDYIHKFDFTIAATKEEAVRLSERVMALEVKAAAYTRLLKILALVLEEMTVATVHYAHADSAGFIDILVFVTDAQVTILMRDNGRPFNPLEYIPEENDGCITDSIQLVKKLASRMEYSRQLGFNTCVLTFEMQ